VVHRDLKSANLLISGKYIKIADFGLARKYEKNSLMNSYKGSLFSMAPEILSGQTYN
jgi:cyclin-dependent kinase 12/13